MCTEQLPPGGYPIAVKYISFINIIVPLRMSTALPKHVEDSNKHITEEIVRQVGYLPELYEDARSKKYKIIAYL